VIYDEAMSTGQPGARVVARALRQARRVIVLVVGGTVLAVGVPMIVLPGPPIVVIPVGLGILATEFVWAQRLLYKIKEQGQRIINRKNPER